MHRHRTVVEQALKSGLEGVRKLADYQLKLIADPRALRVAWDYLASKGGQAPGPNEHRYTDYTETEIWSLLRAIGKAIRNDTYRAGPDRKVSISKGAGRGDRILSLPNIEDRVVQRATVEILQPILDPLFDDRSFGFRRGKGHLRALALAEDIAVREGRWVWVTQDLKNAFDRVPITRLLHRVRHLLPADNLSQLIDRLVGNGSQLGIRQGGPLSPLLLNVYLNAALDRNWRKLHPAIPLIRVADDILLLCKSRTEAHGAFADLERLTTSAGMPLKFTLAESVARLTTAPATWLGFQIGCGWTQLKIQPTPDLETNAWFKLKEKLTLAHEEPDAPVRAEAIIKGWVSQMGPCFPFIDIEAACLQIREIAADLAFDEIPGPDELREWWQHAYSRWGLLRSALIPTLAK
ncbi:MAG: reverse transcriptase domain-containing protein [Gemmataceae bacterium]